MNLFVAAVVSDRALQTKRQFVDGFVRWLQLGDLLLTDAQRASMLSLARFEALVRELFAIEHGGVALAPAQEFLGGASYTTLGGCAESGASLFVQFELMFYGAIDERGARALENVRQQDVALLDASARADPARAWRVLNWI